MSKETIAVELTLNEISALVRASKGKKPDIKQLPGAVKKLRKAGERLYYGEPKRRTGVIEIDQEEVF